MMSLGTRAVEPETLEQRIARRLNEGLDQQIAGGFLSERDAWPCRLREIPGWDNIGPVRLAIQDVSRIAVADARAWF